MALNIIEGGYSDLFINLKYEQFAPPFFLTFCKFLTGIIGEWDWVLRLPSVLSAIGVVWVLSSFLDDLHLDPQWIAATVILCATSFLFLRYSGEFKQYMVDAFIALYWLYWAHKSQFIISNNRQLIWLALGGAISIWFSMPIVFILFGIGVTFLLHGHSSREYRILAPIVLWLVSFAYYFQRILRHDVDKEGLVHAHESFFLDLNFLSAESWDANLGIFINTFSSFFDPTVVSITLATILLVFGIYKLYNHHRYLAISILLSLFSLLMTSGVELYSFIPRLLVFLVPITWLVIGYAFKGISRRWIAVMGIWWVMMTNNNDVVQHALKGAEFEDIKSMLTYIEDADSNDLSIIVEPEGVPAFRFYSQTSFRQLENSSSLLGQRGRPLIDQFVEMDVEGKEYVLLFAHTFPPEKVERISKDFTNRYQVKYQMDGPGASLIHFKK